jgi:hypothetical protein
MKRENKKELNVVDNKLIKMIGDLRTAVNDANDEKDQAKKEVQDLKLLINELDDKKEDKVGVLAVIEEMA